MTSKYKGEIEMGKQLKQEKELFEMIKKDRNKIVNAQRTATLTEEELQDVFIPEHVEGENQLCSIIKDILIENPVNLKIYRDKFNNDQELSNMRGSLSKNKNMTWERFCRWLTILGYDAQVTVSKKEDEE